MMRFDEDESLPTGTHEVILTEANVFCVGGVAFEFCVLSGPFGGRPLYGEATSDDFAEALCVDADKEFEDYVGYSYEIEVAEDGLSFFVRRFLGDGSREHFGPMSAEDEAFLSALDADVQIKPTASATWQQIGF